MKRLLSICAIVFGAALIGAGAAPVETAPNTFVTQHELSIEVGRLNDLLREHVNNDDHAGIVEAKRIDAVLESESKRIDALLAAAKADVALANARAEGTASALAERVDSSAKTLVSQVDVTAKAASAATEAQTKAFDARITPLEQMRYEQAGRGSLSTPLLTTMAMIGGMLLLYAIQQLRVKKEEDIPTAHTRRKS